MNCSYTNLPSNRRKLYGSYCAILRCRLCRATCPNATEGRNASSALSGTIIPRKSFQPFNGRLVLFRLFMRLHAMSSKVK